ncbi:RagB/SusD family nutrient uptake outer membrane protein [Flexithrix dorotheae]|uniref:RagB/SusD family nutrient uptake outer membrane protein n=1 Tax=Flexithrix dorotheae TaxID=70993 RepID=UPI00037E934F|nr:RagB/SusD family nutrient uptake outer membrane protein [Flexithrix dorotheae]
MKRKIKYSFLLLSCLLVFSECEKRLDLSPLGELNSQTFYNTEKDFEAASLAPYSTLLNLYFDQNGRGWFKGILYPGDDVRNPQGSNAQEEFRWLPNDGEFNYLWNESYKGIMRANVIMDRLPLADGFSDEGNKARFEGEAKFLRAYFYFVLVRNYGEVPLVSEVVTSIEDSKIGNATFAELWDFIESDLKVGQENLPESWDADNVGRATSLAATALLGKVKLFRAQWEGNAAKYAEAATELNKLVGKFSLMEDFGANFSENSENNAESVFEIQMTRGDFNPWLPTDFGLPQNQNVGAAGTGRKVFMGTSCHNGNCAPGANSDGYGQVHITSSLQNEFEDGDPRIFHTFYQEGEDYAGAPYDPAWSITGASPAKYLRPFVTGQFPPNWSGNNERVIRYADVLLMLAEAELLGNGNVARAAELINMVRERARNNYEIVNGDPAPADLLPARSAAVDQNQMFQWLMHERRVELALECHRYDDLVRWHRANLINIKTDIDFGNTLAQQNWEPKHLIKPIPQSEIDNNGNLKQNIEYQ